MYCARVSDNKMIIPYYDDEEDVFMDIIQEINTRESLTEKESLYVLWFTLEYINFFHINKIKINESIFHAIDDEYYENPLSIEHEVVLRRLVKQYQSKDIPYKYIHLLKSPHKKILIRAIKNE